MVSVDRRAANILMSDGRLLSLLPAASPIHPWAMNVEGDLSILDEGDGVDADPDALTVGPLRIVLEGMTVVDLRLHQRPRELAMDAVSCLTQLASACPAARRFGAPLFMALEAFRSRRDGTGLVSLIGLGEGLTPSGDDVLVGVLAGLDLACEAWTGASRLRRELAEALALPLATRTSRLSAAMVRAAAGGLFAEPVLGLLRVLGQEEAAATGVEEAAAALRAMGHSSGVDTLQGLAAVLACAVSAGEAH